MLTAGRLRFRYFAWFALLANVLVILWGAVVRATGAGAGCGENWPLCNGAVIPPSPQVKTLIEFAHRATSGLALITVMALVFLAFRLFPRGHIVRRTSLFALGFELLEGLIGASLVKLGHVAGNTSVYRGYTLGLHLTNTLLLLAALSMTAWLAGDDRGSAVWRFRELSPERRRFLLMAGCGLLLIAITGAITALADTLFPAASLAEGMRQDLSAASHPFVRIRILHPILALSWGIYVLVLVGSILQSSEVSYAAKSLGAVLIAVVVVQLSLGIVNLVFMASIPVQIVHLMLADVLWITFVLLAMELSNPLRRPRHRVIPKPQLAEQL